MHIKGKTIRKNELKNAMEEENSTEKPIASTSTGRKNGYGIPTKPKSKLKNPKPSNKEFKGIAYCW